MRLVMKAYFDPSSSAEGTERGIWIERVLLVLLVIGLVAGVGAVILPFTTAILFGASLATAAWPLRQALVRRAGLRQGWAATVLLLGSLALIGIPTFAIAPSLTDQLSTAVA